MATDRKHRRGSHATGGHGLRVVRVDDARHPSTALKDRRSRAAHFDRDGCPRVAPSRGAAAHGFFQAYASCADITQARFLGDPLVRTPAFVRFSSVLGARRGADTVRDVRAFCVKLFTAEGNFDLVGQSFPVLHLDTSPAGVQFPDTFFAGAPDLLDLPFDHAPSFAPVRAALWDYASAVPRTASSLMWLMSDRGVPRSLRMMAGFGVHTFRLVDERGVARLCKLEWRPLLGVHALDAEEAELLTEEDPDFHRRDLWEAIEDGDFPEWELGVRLIDEQRARELGIDLLDASQEIPDEIAPVRPVGKLTLTRNPQSFYEELEQMDFHPSRVVPGIDFTNDPMLQVRLVAGADPLGLLPVPPGRLRRTAEPPPVVAEPAPSFLPASRFIASLGVSERRHLVENVIAELRDLPRDVLLRALSLLGRVDESLALAVAGGSVPLEGAPHHAELTSIRSRRVAVLVADGVCSAQFHHVVAALTAERARIDVVARALGAVTSAEGTAIGVDHTHRTASSIFYDAVFVPGGATAIEALIGQVDAIRFLEQAFRHGKPIGVVGEAVDLLAATMLPSDQVAWLAGREDVVSFQGVVSSGTDIKRFARELIEVMQCHRFFDRPGLVEPESRD